MSKENQINCSYNLDKLNFRKLKKELDIIPKIIRNHNKIGLRSCISASNIYSNKKICITNNSNKETIKIENRNNRNNNAQKSLSLKKSKSIQLMSDEDINIINNNNNNFIERIWFDNTKTILNEEDIFIQIKLENKRQIDKLKSSYEKKYSELNLFYENKFLNLNKLLQKNVSDFTKLYKDYIPLYEHNKIINDIKKANNDLLNKTKQNYEKLINDLTEIIKNKTKYQDLIHRLQLYTVYEIDIKEIEKKLVQKFNEKISEINNKGNDYFKDYYLISQLEEDINYHKKICEMNQLYNEKLCELKINQNNKFDNLLKYVNNLYKDYSNNNIIIINNDINNLNNKKNLKLMNNKKINLDDKSDASNNQIVGKENENKSISYSEKSFENNNHSSSKEIDNLLNIPDSFDNKLNPEIMEINIFNKFTI